ncbi:hypothetical protein [Myxococcus landrumensis]|uniref:Uncharacterized protein n=1 Tax=Myxococcus landrumensis TaxID=2813577 RepID=A0ABX7N7E2_9BACT|nr:hypothetical protein [Myxococcus landrumus]QSQ14391.1 hypothetical protein JY572_39870 [Myxococcus landrumus]
MANCMYEMKALEDVPEWEGLSFAAAGPGYTPVPDASRNSKLPDLPVAEARPDVRDPPPDPEPGVTGRDAPCPEPQPKGGQVRGRGR